MVENKEMSNLNIDLLNKHFFGKVITNVNGLEQESEVVELCFDNNESITMYHEQDCCEHVNVDDVAGPVDLTGAIFYELIEKDSSNANKKEDNDDDWDDDSFTWTFYTIRTSKGYTDIKWYGASNGYYSESVDLKVNVKPLIFINNILISPLDTVHDIYRKIYNRGIELGYDSRLINISLCKYNISYTIFIEKQKLIKYRYPGPHLSNFNINILNNYVDINRYWC